MKWVSFFYDFSIILQLLFCKLICWSCCDENFVIWDLCFYDSSIIRRLLTLINEEAKLAAQCEAYKKQAESATEAAKRLMEEKDNSVNKVRFS